MPIFSRLEGLIRVDTALDGGTWDGTPITIPAGEYFLGSTNGATASLLTVLLAQIGHLDNPAITLDGTTESSTGQVTITTDTGFDVVWGDGQWLADILGYDGDLGTGDEHVSPYHARYLWLPNVGRAAMLGSGEPGEAGIAFTDGAFSRSPSGATKRTAYSVGVHENLEWRYVRGRKLFIAHETVVNESYERFWRDVIGLGGLVRLYDDRSDMGTYQDWAIDDFMHMGARWMDQRWAGAQAHGIVKHHAFEVEPAPEIDFGE